MNDSLSVRAALYASRNAESRTLIFSGKDFLLTEAVELPDNTTVIIDNCTIKQADYTFDNVFRGANGQIDPLDPFGNWLALKPLKNIKILGKGKAVVSGCDKNVTIYHPFFKEEQPGMGDAFGWRTHLFHFAGMDNIEIANLRITQTRGWSICFGLSKNGHLHDIEFDSHSKNGDGVNLRGGCSHFIIENITGYTKDDTVALNGSPAKYAPKRPLSRYFYSGMPWVKFMFKRDSTPDSRDIHDVTIRNLNVSGFYHAVILLSTNNTNIYNVDISNIRDAGSRDTSLVDFYTGHGYGSGYVPGNIHHIRVANIDGNSNHQQLRRRAALAIQLPVKDVTVHNVRNRGNGDDVIITHPEGIMMTGVNKDKVSSRTTIEQQ